jgi:hypothetical protein
MFTFRPRRIEACLIALIGVCAAEEVREAPRADAPPVNQLSISGNACGPAALMASFRCGSETWQKAASALPGTTDREQLGQWIRRYGLRPSATLKGRMRWTGSGINVEDLVTAANEMNQPFYLPQLVHDDLFLRRRETSEDLLRRTHQRLERSLGKGIPPLLSLRRFVLRKGSWVPLQGHFVTVVAVPKKLPRNGQGFALTYLDPWGGKRCEGKLGIASRSLLAAPGQSSPCLEAQVPSAKIARDQVRRGETTAVVPAAVIGRW